MDIDNLEEFITIDKRIDAAEEQVGELQRESLRDRWEFGHLMLAKRKGKQLPKGMLDKLVEETGKSKTELWFRAQFAERYPTEDEVLTAIRTFGSWTQIKKNLPKPPSDKPPAPPSEPPQRPKKHDRYDEVVALRDEGLTIREIHEKTGMGRQVEHILNDEKIARASEAEARPIAWETIPGNQREKMEKAKAVIRKQLEKELHAQMLAALDQYKADYKAQFDAQREILNKMRDEERQRYQLGIEAQRAKGLITLDDYNVIRSCLHPDSRVSVTDEKLAAAFRVFNDPRIKMLLVKEK
jgi:BMFP domain-containing protein YqiC